MTNQASNLQEILSTGTISDIAKFIKTDWKKIPLNAKVYIDAMLEINNIDAKYGLDDAKTIVLYFLANAVTYRGENAKIIKKHLNTLIK